MADTVRLEGLPIATSVAGGDVTHVETGTPAIRVDQQISCDDYASSLRKLGVILSGEIYRSAALTINTATDTVVSWDAKASAAAGLADGAGPWTKYTIPTAGLWRFNVGVLWPSNATGIRSIRFKLNGTTFIGGSISPSMADATHVFTCAELVRRMAVNDYVEVVLYQQSGANLALAVGAEQVFYRTLFQGVNS